MMTQKVNYMVDDDSNLIAMTSKHSQKCISCSRIISLIEKETYMCSKCKQYFCTECFPLFVNADKCPGGFQEVHEPIMVRITRTIKEYAPLGVSIDQIEKNKTSSKPTKSSIKIINDENQKKDSNDPKKPRLKILDE